MKENILQLKLIEIIKEEKFLDSIENIISLDDAIKIDNDSNTIPNFSIDHLLKRKYSKAAKNVLKTLSCYELISGDIIQNISLDKNEKLFPDCLIFNYETNEIVVIENKVSKQTEREALTELFGYTQEIRNCLPFISDYDISYILISTEYNTLLDHSISSQILNTEINILCLRPLQRDNNLYFEVHFPKSWSNIGQNGLPTSSLMSYTLCLKKNYFNDDFYLSTIQQAVDLLNFEAGINKSNGFCIVWENGIKEFCDFDFGISIYIINPFVFLPNAIELGFDINNNSKLAEFILNRIDSAGIEQTPNSLFRISEKAKKILDRYFVVEWDRNTSWEQDINDDLYNIQRFPVIVNSWGVIGEFIRYFYFHPGVIKHLFCEKEIFNRSCNSPFIALQIINIITGNYLFKMGQFSVKDIFRFGQQLYYYGYSCKIALETKEDKIVSNEALLFWSNLQLVKSLKEISFRVNDLNHINYKEIPKIKFYFTKNSVEEDFKEKIDLFAEWFINKFIKSNSFHKSIFEIGLNYAPFFNPFYKGSLEKDDLDKIKNSLNEFAIVKLLDIIKSYKDRSLYLEEKVIDLINDLLNFDIKINTNENIRRNVELIDYSNCFSDDLIEIFNSIYGQIQHELKDAYISSSIDFNFLKDSADKLFKVGEKYSAIIIAANGDVGLCKLNEEFKFMGELVSTDEIYLIMNSATGLPIIRKRKWLDIFNGDLG